MTPTLVRPSRRFDVPPDRIASDPPERRGLPRDGVNLLVARPERIDHVRFGDLPRFMRPGDLVVVNTSATRPAAVDGALDGRPVTVHLATAQADGAWVVELRRADGDGPVLDRDVGDVVDLPGDACVELVRPVTDARRLWRARVVVPGGAVDGYMAVHGRPITYGRPVRRWPLSAYQPVFAMRPGSAEMASAGRPFTDRMVTDLVRNGVAVAPVTLHAGVSSLEAHEPPVDEWYEVPATTAAQVSATRRAGGRVVAVGTTVTRALETIAGVDGRLTPGAGWTDLLLGPDRPARIVDGLVTGWHEADASHLLLLEAVAGAALVDRAYDGALAGPYLWHEFGDSCLLLP
ncbi:MAG TPA: S-adenosylmethionine:tRNA ribosyltransferase-isomerase [Euzebyales bacterium]|nr:S-adenosylmethionine:tRNA ribosyltransferase-isomerase [Euzebyales bacterium]